MVAADDEVCEGFAVRGELVRGGLMLEVRDGLRLLRETMVVISSRGGGGKPGLP